MTKEARGTLLTTVTLNPCIDYTVHLPEIQRGQLNLVQGSRTDMSGKGINVSAVLAQLSAPTFATGISFTGNHNLLSQYLDKHKIPFEFTLASGTIRTNVKIIEDDGTHTEINSPGDWIGEEVLREFFDLLEKLLPNTSLLICSGRIPNGAPEHIYKDIIQLADKHGSKVFLDTGGASLVDGVIASPAFIKPNELEFEQLTGYAPDDLLITAEISRELIAERRLEYICVSLGSRGALLTDARASYFAQPLSIPAQGVTGAGDSMVAGMAKAYQENKSTADMLRFGMAAAGGTVLREGTLLCRREEFLHLLPEVKIQKIL